MATASQRTANRANAQHSTGPTSPEGKAICSQNGLKHGLSTSQLLIPGEDPEDFNALLESLLAAHQPANLTETMLIQDMAKHHWLADRAIRMQNHAIAHEGPFPPPACLAILIRYQTTNDRAYHRALSALNTSRKTRLAEIGSASKSAEQAAKTAAKEASTEALQREKLRQAERLAAIIRSCQPPTEAAMNASGYFKNPETGLWENKNE